VESKRYPNIVKSLLFPPDMWDRPDRKFRQMASVSSPSLPPRRPSPPSGILSFAALNPSPVAAAATGDDGEASARPFRLALLRFLFPLHLLRLRLVGLALPFLLVVLAIAEPLPSRSQAQVRPDSIHAVDPLTLGVLSRFLIFLFRNFEGLSLCYVLLPYGRCSIYLDSLI
jgi:hypothetical protein